MKFYIENIAGGSRKEFRWNDKGLSLAALRHTHSASMYGGPVFGGEAGDLARAEYDDIYEQYLSGECTETVERIFAF
jgi:hypothetical protein